AKKIAVIREDNFWGDEAIGQLRLRARELGLQVLTEQIVATFAKTSDVAAALRAIQSLDADVIVYLGAGFAMANVIEAIKAAGKLPRIVFNSSFDMLAPEVSGASGKLPDIAGIAQIHEGNATLTAVLDRFEKRYGRRPAHAFTALGYDLGHMLALGLSQARPHSRDGLKQALEKIRRIPTAVGTPGTHMGFLPWDHRGYKGGYLLLREIRDGKNQPIDMPTALIA
ncbi:MAG: ABC transporter substrate-binding protein, partial [Spongiibacteraceae bacterium]